MALTAADAGPIYNLLEAALNEATRKEAEQALNAYETRVGFCSCLLEIISRKELDQKGGARWLAAIYFKNSINRYWRARRETQGISDEEKPVLRARLLELVADENSQVAVQLAVLIAKIARIDYPREWSELFPTLLQKLQSQDPLLTQRAYLVLNHVLKELSTKRLSVDQRTFSQVTSQLFEPTWAHWEVPVLEQVVPAFLEAAQSLLNFRNLSQQRPALQPLHTFLSRASVKLLKTLVASHELHPFSFASKSVLLPTLDFCYTQITTTDPTASSPSPSLSTPLAAATSPQTPATAAAAAAAATDASASSSASSHGLFLIECMLFLQSVLRCVAYKQNPTGHVVGAAVASAEEMRGKLSGMARQQLQGFFSQEKVVTLGGVLVQRYLVLTAGDLEEWGADPEVFYHEQGAVQWKDKLQLCQSSLFHLSLFLALPDSLLCLFSQLLGADSSGFRGVGGGPRADLEEWGADPEVFYDEQGTVHYLVLTAGDLEESGADPEVFYHEQGAVQWKDKLRPSSYPLHLSLSSSVSLPCLADSYLVLTAGDLEEWGLDPEVFYHEQGAVQWKDKLRPCAEALLLLLFEQFKECIEACPPPASPDADVPVTPALLLKDACYDAVGVACYDLHDVVDFKTWFTTALLPDMACRHPNARILRRRAAWMVGQWVGKVEGDLCVPAYQALISLLPDEDLVVQCGAGCTGCGLAAWMVGQWVGKVEGDLCVPAYQALISLLPDEDLVVQAVASAGGRAAWMVGQWVGKVEGDLCASLPGAHLPAARRRSGGPVDMHFYEDQFPSSHIVSFFSAPPTALPAHPRRPQLTAVSSLRTLIDDVHFYEDQFALFPNASSFLPPSLDTSPTLPIHQLTAVSSLHTLIDDLTAVSSLRTLIDDVHFYEDQFAPFLDTAVQLLFRCLQQVSEFDSQLQIVNVVSLIIERMGEKIVPLADKILSCLPQVWEQSEGQPLLRIQVMQALQRLIVSLGPQSPISYPLLFPILRYSTDISQPDELNMLEDGLQLWQATLRHAPAMVPEFMTLFANLVPIMDRSFEHLPVATAIMESYVLVGGPAFLQQHAGSLVSMIDAVVGNVKEKAMLLVAGLVDLIIQCYPSEAPPALESVLQKLLLIIIGPTEYSDLVRGTCATVLARVVLQNSSYFAQFISADSTRHLLQQQSAAKGNAPPLALFLDAWLDKVDSVSVPAKRKLSTLALAVLLTMPEPQILERLDLILSVCTGSLGEDNPDNTPLLPDISTVGYDYASVSDSIQGGEGAPVECEALRRRQVASIDPVHRVAVGPFLKEKLQACVAVHGEQQFQAAMARVPPPIVSQLQQL
ncbi:unnamed protein product [Closterium sp. NIES-65]|nr:unnamed protein product [Closterium sp. NIES-65]